MRIGVISDTHIPTRAKHLPSDLFKIFEGVEMVLHAGDITDPQVLLDLRAIAPVEAVAGNMDTPELHKRLGRKKILQLAGFRIGLIHGDLGIERSKIPQGALGAFDHDHVNAIVFGHSHQPYHQTVNGILLFNPGSPTDRAGESHFTCGLFTLEQSIQADIIRL